MVFTGNADIGNVKLSNHVICDDELEATIHSYRTECLSEQDVQSVEESLFKEVENMEVFMAVSTIPNANLQCTYKLRLNVKFF